MKVSECKLAGVKIITPRVFEDNRGFFLESYNRSKYSECGMDQDFVQDNHSKSVKNTLRGLHYQVNPGQDKIVRVIAGEVFDVVVDIRRDSSTYGQWEGFVLSAGNKVQIYVPKGFAHGFCVLSDEAEFVYKCSEYWSPKDERGIIWNDPDINVRWPVSDPVLSAKDLQNLPLKELEPFN